MSVLNSLFSPLSVAFIVIIIGYYVGSIKVFGVSLDLAGVLIVAVIVGYLLNTYRATIDATVLSEIQSNMKIFSSLGTALFVSVVGIIAGYSTNIKIWKDLKAIPIGALMVISAFVAMKIISVCDVEVSNSELLGSLCGALTTTPGLSTVCELENIVVEDAVLGYGCTYLFGVVFTVLFVQIIKGKFKKNLFVEEKLKDMTSNEWSFDVILQIGIVVLFGRLIGGLRIFDFSFGNTGGMLCVGICVGLIIKKWLPKKLASSKSLGLFRNFGLVLFFVGTGIPAGMLICKGIKINLVFYGILMTITPIFTGYVFYKILFRKDVDLIASVIAGGMTSTPAIGVLVQKKENLILSRYSLAYVSALITVIVLVRVLKNVY